MFLSCLKRNREPNEYKTSAFLCQLMAQSESDPIIERKKADIRVC
ncbi:hypothetical protein HOLDEFILI_00031 [Holdemania filiformis DSM 12042]|uniref:Uncharacterized protein n=1 Tax=Holdemania filiformis DSM 12042 TaxID=545696 RepID=B9Y2K6_9FIRM|nr:hypothetical protein HOLDEFILI_00031 [Holdemania filiformis DSM 12042]